MIIVAIRPFFILGAKFVIRALEHLVDKYLISSLGLLKNYNLLHFYNASDKDQKDIHPQCLLLLLELLAPDYY